MNLYDIREPHQMRLIEQHAKTLREMLTVATEAFASKGMKADIAALVFCDEVIELAKDTSLSKEDRIALSHLATRICELASDVRKISMVPK